MKTEDQDVVLRAPRLRVQDLVSSPRFVRWLLLAFLALTNTLYAKDDERIDFNQLRTAQTATFFLVPWSDLTFIRLPRWDESILKELGCTYTTQDPVHIANLIGILEHADIKKASGSEAEFLSARNGELMMMSADQAIYLTLADGTEAKFLLGAGWNPDIKTVPGQFTHVPEFKNFPLRARRSLTRSLVQWAVAVGKPDGSGPETAHELDEQWADYLSSPYKANLNPPLSAQWAADRRKPEAKKEYIEFWCDRYTTERSSHE